MKDILTYFNNKLSPLFVTTIKLYTVIIICVLTNSCKKENMASDFTENPDSFHKIFIQFWEKMNNQYVYWDRENTDWNDVYDKYKPIFDNLTNNDVDKRKSIYYFKEMTSDLIDGHFLITFNDKLLADSIINPSMARKIKSTNFHDKYNYDEIVNSYLDPGFLSNKGNIIQNGTLLKATAGRINNNLLYFHCNFFSLKQSYSSNDGNKLNEVLEYFFSSIKKDSNSIKGIILDLRNNSGGDIADLNFIAGKLIDQDIVFGYTRSKTGLGKLNYLPWLEAMIKHDSDYHVTVPIVILGDNFSASLSETLIIALKTKKNCLFVGEQTYGATGPLSDPTIFNSGSFNVGSFLSVKTSSVEFKSINGSGFEGKGITPDINSPFNYKSLLKRRDLQLEIAITQLKNQ